MSGNGSMEEYNLSILIPTQFVGLLIGKNGSCFRDLAKISKCRLFLQSYEDIPELSRERVLTLVGTKISVLIALRKVIELIQPCTKSMSATGLGGIGSSGGWEMQQSDGNQIIKWVISQSDCGTLIGRGGEGIKRINELSGSWVKVAHLEDSVRGVNER
jgi:transcription antitermination factor NusA-like protein